MSDKTPQKSDNYIPRAGTDCAMLGELEEQPCWGVVRFSKLECYLCEGHRAPPNYIEEPKAPTEEERAKLQAEIDVQLKAELAAKNAAIEKWGVPMTDHEWLEAGWTAATWSNHQANRWFRPLLNGITEVGTGMFFPDLTDLMLTFIHSMIGEGIRCGDGSEAVDAELLELGRQATAEMHHRGVPWPEGCYQLKLAPEPEGPIIIMGDRNSPYYNPFGERLLRMLPHHLTNREVQLLYGCAMVVEDFSCLERGCRQCVSEVSSVMGREIESREIPDSEWDDGPKFLSELAW